MQTNDEQTEEINKQLEDDIDLSNSDEQIEVVEQTEEPNDTKQQDEHYDSDPAKSADEIVDEARDMVETSDAKVKDCLEILDEDLSAFEEEKARVLKGSAHKTEALLEEVGFRADDIGSMVEQGAGFENRDSVSSMSVEPLSSGKFCASILGLVTGAVVALVWIYVAMQRTGTKLSDALQPESIDKALLWIGGGMTGGEGNVVAGIVVLATSALLAMWLVYLAKVFFKQKSNKKLAKQVLEDAKFYCTKKEECQQEMLRVSDHINKTINSLKTYDVLFDELNSKISRALHFEGELSFGAYHPKTKEDMKRAHMLISGIKELLKTPMASEDGLLSNDAIEALEKSDYSVELYKEKLYE
jgi:hypothetical protein